jgi:enoyl-CoA hydratase
VTALESYPITREDRNGVALLRLTRGKANALDVELVEALVRKLDEIQADGACRALVLTGHGPIFSAGVDLIRVVEGGREYVRRFVPALVRAFSRLFEFPRPVVAAVNGHAIAGGCVLVSACDYRVMAAGPGTIGVPELRVQVPFPAVALEILRFAARAGHFQELVYLGKTYGVAEARARDLIDEIVPAAELEERACVIARRLGAIPPEVFALTKAQVRAPHLRHLASVDDAAVARLWEDHATFDAVRRYVREKLGR